MVSHIRKYRRFRLSSQLALAILLAIFSSDWGGYNAFAGIVGNVAPQAVFAICGFVAESSPLVPLPEPEVPTGPGVPAGPGESVQPPDQAGGTNSASGLDQRSGSPSGQRIPSDREQDQPKGKSSSLSFWGIVRAGGTVGILIMLLSIISVALAVEHLFALRQDLFLPPAVIQEASAKLSARDWNGVLEICRANPSVLSEVLASGVREHEAGWSEMEKVMEETLAEQTARWNRKVEYLSVIGNIAPMLGLLGTVIGMILAFRTVAETQGAARAADLAEAIYLALVTTVEGLIVAIPSLAAYAFFRNRVDELMAEVAGTVQKMFAPLKRRRPAVGKPTSVPPPAGASH
ncbi:MAG: MotA/TolQ/ExbB proton channel family protein [Thermogutta sp.]